MYILGVSALYHDSAAAIIKDGEIIAAAQEERFTRKKHDNSIPANAIAYCLAEAGIKPQDLSAVVYYDNPILTTERFVANLQYAGDDTEDLLNFTLEDLIWKKLWIHKLLPQAMGGALISDGIFVTEHHISHAASAFFPSPFQKAAIITMDGVGEWATTTIGYGEDNHIKLYKQINYPHSVGLLYSAFTYFCGFKVNSGDYKLMGLAPYGEPVYYDTIVQNLIDIKSDGSYRLNLEYFDFQYGRAMTNDRFAQLFGGARRMPETNITKREMDMAASIQKVVEEIVILTARTAKKLTGGETDNLVLAGGVALNCVANGKLQKENIFKNIWLQPAAGDAGGALGAALYYYYQRCNNKRAADGIHDAQKGSYLGPAFSDADIEKVLAENHCIYHKMETAAALYETAAELIDTGNVIGLFEGRMEFGPRALGNRSIIADARSSEMQSKLNLKIKYRESFRPFAPAVLEEDASSYFDLEGNSPYMLKCANVKDSIKKSFDLGNAMGETD
ncbi:MAG: hypothetical protein NC180_13080, partial [Muribaculaceae bacterium]|nr:hypothetical protein [Muribaculaceae bacterium]